MTKGRNSVLCLMLLSLVIHCSGFNYPGSGMKTRQDSLGKGGYLFAHMTTDEYGRLYYSLSRDGLHWKLLNSGRKISLEYRGHPDICKGGDDTYYMIGIEEGSYEPVLWRSDSLINWRKEKYLPGSVFLDSTPGYQANVLWYGAPKMFYDEASMQYIISWHAPEKGIEGGKKMWESMRTFYILTSDFKTFTKARRLFEFEEEADREMATIDVVIRESEGIYYAVIKDERWPETSNTGKTIRISTSADLTGPYSDPGPPVTPSWFEAPSIVSKINDHGWFLYAESYPNRYMLFKADSLSGYWSPVDCNLEKVRHGCVVSIDEELFENLESFYYNALPTIKILTPHNRSVLYSSAGNIVEIVASDEDGTIESADLYVDGVWIPELEHAPGRYDIDFLEAGVHKITAEVVDNKGGVAKDSVSVIVADSLLSIGDWILYQRNGALASFSIEQDTLRIQVERASGNLSDLLIYKEIGLPGIKSSSSSQVSFMASANKYTLLELAIKDEPYLETTLISKTFPITPQFDTYVLYGVPLSESGNFLAFNLGYGSETTYYITNLNIDYLNSNKVGVLDHPETIYPNPVSTFLYFSCETDYKIYAFAGSLVQQGEKALKSDMSVLPAGFYVVKTEFGDFRIAKTH